MIIQAAAVYAKAFNLPVAFGSSIPQVNQSFPNHDMNDQNQVKALSPRPLHEAPFAIQCFAGRRS